jgi:quercetin dioxygenase-like cupin family protein
MKLIHYSDVTPTYIDNEKAKGIAGRVVIGKNDNANNFCMRIFEISAGGNTPMHAHDWEHEMFFHAGSGEIFLDGKWNPVAAGKVAFVPGKEEHQIKNTGKEKLVLACLIPSGVPEL